MKRKYAFKTEGEIGSRYETLLRWLEDGLVFDEERKLLKRSNIVPVQEKAYEVAKIIQDMKLTGNEMKYFLELVELIVLDRWIR